MTTTNGKAVQPPEHTQRFSSEEKDIIKNVIAKGATDAELKVFLAICERTGLDPFAKQIYCIKRWDSTERKEVMTPQVSIDGLRILAERTGKYIAFVGPHWCGEDGVWRDVWLSNDPPKAARFGVQKEGAAELVWAVARWGSYVQTTKEGKVTPVWARMPDVMLGNAAERLALRRAFPCDLSAAVAVSETDAAPAAGESDVADFEIVAETTTANTPAPRLALATADDHALIDSLLREYRDIPLGGDLTEAKRDLMVWVSVHSESDPAKMTAAQARVAIDRLQAKVFAMQEEDSNQQE